MQEDALTIGLELRNSVCRGGGCEEQVGRGIEGNGETLKTRPGSAPTLNYFFLVSGLPCAEHMSGKQLEDT